MVWLTEARAPEGMRLYAIGDVHGCLDPLVELHAAIAADLADRPVRDWRILHIGDYVDRGPESQGVIDFLSGRAAEDGRVVCLRGNHDEMFLGALAGDRHMAGLWLRNGGVETLGSYGVDLTDYLDALRAGGSAEDTVPAAHRAFLLGLPTSTRLGDYYFVHAGIDPGLPLDQQEPQAQLWIREKFLTSAAEFDVVVVHGHTPSGSVDVRPNRVGIDTGAVFGGELSCLVLDGAGKAILTEAGLRPLPRPGPGVPSAPDRPGSSFARAIRSRLAQRFGGGSR